MLPHSYAWTRGQKWAITMASTLALITASIGIYSYERHHRGLPDSVFFGTWRLEDGCIDCTNWVMLQPDHKVVGFGESMGMRFLDYGGRWYAGGELLTIHYELPEESYANTMRILDITRDAIRVRSAGRELRMTRSDAAPPNASN